MTLRVKVLIALTIATGMGSVWWVSGFHTQTWGRFLVYLVAVLLSSGLKVAMPKGQGTLSVNFPFILLGVIQLSPPEALALAALSVFAQCRFKVIKPFTFVQIAFNLANVATATVVAILIFTACNRHSYELAPAIALASVGYFFTNTVPMALVIGWSTGERPYSLWRREFLWYMPFYLVGAVLAAVGDIISVRFGWVTSLLLVPVVYTIYRAYRSQMNMLRDRQKHLDDMEALHLRTIEGLAMAIEAKDQNTHDHLLRVRAYVSEIGKSLGLPELQLQALLTAAFLHDIGKLAVPEHIINKPGKLTHEEFEKMKIHPVVGADILERVRFPYPVVPIVRSHHECWDGAGYPDGLKGEEIPIGARILAVVDCFDALASDRPYRKAMPLDEAMAWVESRSGTQFDPAVVEVLGRRYVELEEHVRHEGVGLPPLNTELEIWRGTAPGAGFAADEDEPESRNLPGNLPGASRAAAADAIVEGAEWASRCGSLDLIAAAGQEAQHIFEMSQLLGNSLSPSETSSMMSSRLRRLIPFQCFALYLRTENVLSAHFMEGEGALCFSGSELAVGEGVSGWVAQSGRPILNGNPALEPHYNSSPNAGAQLRSALALPLFDVTGALFGVLSVYAQAADAFSRDHLRILQAIESKFSLSIENALRFRKTQSDAGMDFITQLPNVRQFFLHMEAELAEARHRGAELSLAMCDLNSFKAVNDRSGHMTGNLLLRAIADALRECCREGDTVARMGGDEFVFLFPGLDAHGCQMQLERIQLAVRRACKEIGIATEVSASVGAAFFPVDGTSVEELLGAADRRMYFHKNNHYGLTVRDVRGSMNTSMPAVA